MTVVDIPELDDPFAPDTDIGAKHVVDWNGVYAYGNHILQAGYQAVADWLGLSTDQQSRDLGTVVTDIIVYEHADNIRDQFRQQQIEWNLEAIVSLGQAFTNFEIDTLLSEISTLNIIAGLIGQGQGGTTTGLTADQVSALIDTKIAPLIDNLGVINTRLDQLEQRVGRLEAKEQTDTQVLTGQVTDIVNWLNTNLVPILGTLTALAGANVLTRLAQQEECCASNSNDLSGIKDLLNKLKPLLDLLKLLDVAALLALLEHIWSEGFEGFAREVEGIVDAHLGGAEGAIAGFLGI
jgi:hypothetical protein